MIPALAQVYLPVLTTVVLSLWPAMPDPALLAAQVEQETCVSLTHRKCWNPRAELKTSREYGFGLGQLTVTKRFDNFKAARGWDKSLAGWQWEQRYDPQMQLRALVAYDRNLYRSVAFGATELDRFAFMFSAYNGGLGAGSGVGYGVRDVLADRDAALVVIAQRTAVAKTQSKADAKFDGLQKQHNDLVAELDRVRERARADADLAAGQLALQERQAHEKTSPLQKDITNAKALAAAAGRRSCSLTNDWVRLYDAPQHRDPVRARSAGL